MNIDRNWWRKGALWAIVVIAVAAAFAAGRLMAPDAHHEHSGHADPAASSDGQQQMYTCAMHPTVRTPNPNDKCPICGMDLIPVPSDAEDAADASLPRLRVSPRAAALMAIQTWPVERKHVDVPVPLFGRIDYDETRLRAIAARVPGRLDRLYVNFTGAAVKGGEPVALIYSPTLFSAQEELLQAVRAGKALDGRAAGLITQTNDTLLQAAREKLRLFGLGSEQISEIEQRGQVSEHLTIQAPVGGTVIERHATEGMYVETGDRIYTLADLSSLWVLMEVYESDLHWFRVGQKALFTTEAYPGEQFEGTITFIDPVLNSQTRTARVRASLANPGGRLKPAMFVRGRVLARAGEGAPASAMLASLGNENAAHAMDSAQTTEAPLVIPASAPLITGKRAVVYVQVADADSPTFEGRQIVLGPKAGDHYIVREGLSEGEQVVINGNFKIDSELQIRGRPSMMAPQGGGAPVHQHGGQDAAAHAGHQPAAAPGAQAPAAARQQPQQAEVPAEFSQQIGELVQANFALVDALSKDDLAAAQKAVTAAREALAAVDMGLLQGDAHDAWMKSQKKMEEALKAMADAKELVAMRSQFEIFSDELTISVRSFGTGSIAPVYRAMCPMVNRRKGYWLQPHKPVTNPYWGEAMFRCGEVVETLVEEAPGEGR